MTPSNSGPSSPTHFGMPGHFTPEEIQEILGAMSTEHMQDGISAGLHHNPQATTTNHDVHTTSFQQPAQAVAPVPSAHAVTHAAPHSNATHSNASMAPPQAHMACTALASAASLAACATRSGGAAAGAMTDTSSIPSNNAAAFKMDDQASVQPGVNANVAAEARSERKRTREKQRRFDVNRRFNDLTQLIKQIEADEAQGDATKVSITFSPTNRVDLIARTIAHLERLHEANKRSKAETENLQQQLKDARRAGEETAQKLKETMFSSPSSKQMMMMVPMMMNPNQMQYGGAAAGGPGASPMPMMNPFMMHQQQQFMALHMASQAAQAPSPMAASGPVASPAASVAGSTSTPQQQPQQQQSQAQAASVAATAPATSAASTTSQGSNSSQQQQQPDHTPAAMGMGAMQMPFGAGMMMPMQQQQMMMMAAAQNQNGMPYMMQPMAPTPPVASVAAMPGSGMMNVALPSQPQQQALQGNSSLAQPTSGGSSPSSLPGAQQEAKTADSPTQDSSGGANLAHCA